MSKRHVGTLGRERNQPHDAPIECVGHPGCQDAPVPGCPVPLCPHHLRRLHEWTLDFIDQRLGRPG